MLSQGQYDKARNALEMAIRTHPSYATAHENLGDIYAKMASQAYDKALQIDRGNATAQTKLNLIKELFSSSQRPAKVAMAKAEPALKAPPPAPAAKTPAPAAKAPAATAAAPTPAPAATVPAATAAAKPAPAEPAKPASTENADEVLQCGQSLGERVVGQRRRGLSCPLRAHLQDPRRGAAQQMGSAAQSAYRQAAQNPGRDRSAESERSTTRTGPR